MESCAKGRAKWGDGSPSGSGTLLAAQGGHKKMSGGNVVGLESGAGGVAAGSDRSGPRDSVVR